MRTAGQGGRAPKRGNQRMSELTIILYRFSMAFAPQLWIAEMLFAHKHVRRKYFWLRAVAFGILFSVLPELLPNTYFCPWLTVAGWIRLSYPLLFLLSLLGLFFCCKAPFLDLLFIATAAYALQNGSFSVTEFVRLNLDSPLAAALLTIAIMAVCYAFFYLLIVRNLRRYGSVGFHGLPLLTFSLLTLVIAYLMNMYMQAFERASISARVFNIIADMLLLVCLFDLFHVTRIRRDADVTEQLLKLSEQELDLTQENIEIINRKCHDLKHQLSAYDAADDADRAEYLDEIKRSILIYDSSIQTGNKALDVVLMEKKLLCNKLHIDFSFIVDGEKLAFMKNSDLFSLFGNALDNAIESLREEKPESRVLTLKVTGNGSITNICLENYCSKVLHFEDGLPVSTKVNDGYHGFGMKSIRFIVQKYDGQMLVYKKDNRFVLEILFT